MIDHQGASPDAALRARRVFDERLAQRRERERACALDFIYHGNLDGRHDKRCVHAEPCSRNYQPRPYPEAEPVDLKEYEGTGIGLLYGAGPDYLDSDARRMLLTLAGWNLTGPPERLLHQEYAATPSYKEMP